VEGGPLEQFNEAIDDLARKLKPEKWLKKLTKAVFWSLDKNEITPHGRIEGALAA